MNQILNWADLNTKDVQQATAEVICNELKQCLRKETKDDLVFKVRALTLAENLAAQALRDSSEIEVFEALAKAFTNKGNLEEKIKELIGASGEMNKQTKFYMEIVHLGVVEPKLDYEKIAWIATHFPTVVLRLCHKIMGLTGSGSMMIKKKLSGSSEKTDVSTPSSALQKNLEKPLEKLTQESSAQKT